MMAQSINLIRVGPSGERLRLGLGEGVAGMRTIIINFWPIEVFGLKRSMGIFRKSQ